jgi:predicted RNase H-like HicB family nuclease
MERKAGYVSKCPELGVTSCGDSCDESVGNVREAVEFYLENAMELDMFDEIKESLTAKGKFTAHLEATLSMTKLPVIPSKKASKHSDLLVSRMPPISLSSLDQAGQTKDEFIDLMKR